jgi:hypothetical protein
MAKAAARFRRKEKNEKRLGEPQPLLIGNYNIGIQRRVNLANEKSVLQHEREILRPGKDLSAQMFFHKWI